MADEYRRFWITSSDAQERERLLAEAFEAGAEGAEEVDDESGFRACIYAPSGEIEAIRTALLACASPTTAIDAAEVMPTVDWSEKWKEGLDPIEISPRLVVRPPFAEFALAPGQREIVIDPGQAFGIGGHASTRLCLEWIDALIAAVRDSDPPAAARIDRVLDVGTGSGVLALAAVVLGADSALGFDLDPIAIEAAQAAARSNDAAARVHFFTGPIEAVAESERPFPLVLANLLKKEMLPIAGEIARRVAPDGRLVLAGLLEEDVPEVARCFAEYGLVEIGRRAREDDVGRWIAPCLAFSEAGV